MPFAAIMLVSLEENRAESGRHRRCATDVTTGAFHQSAFARQAGVGVAAGSGGASEADGIGC